MNALLLTASVRLMQTHRLALVLVLWLAVYACFVLTVYLVRAWRWRFPRCTWDRPCNRVTCWRCQQRQNGKG